MNDTLLKIMEFINNNTLLLIGICVFLILVLIGYLIDNSVKSKRIRNDIKNADQVPENIKNEIIKEAEAKEKTLSSVEVQTKEPEVQTVNETTVVNANNSDLDVKLDLDSTNTTMDKIDINSVDPDINIMTNNQEYSNDKKLSEILSNVNNIVVNDTNNDIFSNNMPDIQINTDVSKDDVKIETDNTSDELDRIMKKLSTMNNNDEDSYTNIF